MIKIEVKEGVELHGIDRRVWNAVGVVAGVYFEQHGVERLLITSGREGTHGVASWHYVGRAIDFDWPDAEFEINNEGGRARRLALRAKVLEAVGSRFESVAHLTHLHLELERG